MKTSWALTLTFFNVFLFGSPNSSAEEWLIAQLDSPYLNCKMSMKGHESPIYGTQICLEGSGIYRMDSVKLLSQVRDFFPVLEYGHQFDRVRFVCNSNGKDAYSNLTLPREPIVVFPSKEQSEAGKGLELVIPCNISPSILAKRMQDVQVLGVLAAKGESLIGKL